ncbi:MAG: SIMPL domain-containing protein [Parachlamydiaceae bacterium]|nr:SIMPL domain-containing protein [Parachlamydiaceae bacterium]
MLRKIGFILCFLASPVFAQEHRSTLTLHGVAVLNKPADQLQITIGVVSEGAHAEEALRDNSEKMRAIISALQMKELSNKEYSTGQFSISPTYTPYPKNPPPEWTQKINGYRVSNLLLIQTDKLNLAGQIIDAVSQAGANSIDQISFGLKDDRLYRQEAIRQATEHAKQDAENLASAANLKLGPILQISLDTGTPEPRIFRHFAEAVEKSTPIEPGEVTVNAGVKIVYHVNPN